MQISFVRTQGSPDRVYVRRGNGSEVSWSFPTYGDGLPHDLVHLVVESCFCLRNGFWARVDAGVDVARINAEANRKGGPNKYAGFGGDQTDLYLSEALAAGTWITTPELSDVRAACDRARITMPAFVTIEKLRAARDSFSQLRLRWRSLTPRGALDVTFDPSRPEEGFVLTPL